MRRYLGGFIAALLLASTYAAMATGSFFQGALYLPPPVNPTFTALHTYFVAASGCSESNAGTSAGAPWCTPNHVSGSPSGFTGYVCGDVVIAAAGTYSTGQFGDTFQIPSSCPSTSGGIDGTGGVYFVVLLCGGADLMACNVTTTGGGDPTTLVELNTPNVGGTYTNPVTPYWAIEGFNLNSTPASRGFGVRTTNSSEGLLHHFAFINNIVSDSMQAVGGNDGGTGGTTTGADYEAIIGDIAQNANQNGAVEPGTCVGAFDFTNLGQYDTNAGTHAYAYGNFAMANLVPACSTTPGSDFDGEAYLTDTPNAHSFQGTIVYANNIGYDSTRSCIQLDGGGANPITIKIYDNTCYYNNLQGGNTSVNGSLAEFFIDASSGTYPFSVSFWNNILLTPAITEQGVPLYDEIIGGATLASWLEGTAVGASDQNVMQSQQTVCLSTCAPTSSPYTSSYYMSNPVATNSQNTYSNPNYNNTTDLLANWVGVPNCTGFINTTACMGWNAATNTLTTPSVISDLLATAVGSSPYYSAAAGKGYQLPSTTCATNADYPTWLKGVVYLHWNGTSLTENRDLVTKPCGL